MNRTTSITGTYGVVTIIGGIIGYFAAGSMISLWTGLIAGLLLVIAALGILSEYRWGFQLGGGVSLALALFFIFRFIGSGKWFPAGIMMIFSLLVLVILYWQLWKNFPSTPVKEEEKEEE